MMTGATSRILVVDDERLIQLTLSAKLRRIGYTPVAVGDVDSAVKALKESPKSFGAVITDIMMGDMDGFMFRDIVRGIEPALPVFFLTALDPEEGSGFLKRIMEDPISYYLPKSVQSDVLLKRVQQVVASRRVERFIMDKIEEDRKSLGLAAHIQSCMLPARALMTPRGFYTMCWHPIDVVSGDLFEAVPFGTGTYLYVIGDIQGHGTSAALAMTAVQSFLKNMRHRDGTHYIPPDEIANMLHEFFRTNLADVSYMTALICVHRPLLGEVRWISCGAPDLTVLDGGRQIDSNPSRRGALPIGLMPDTVYTDADVVVTPLTKTALCVAFTDGLMDLSSDDDGAEKLPMELSHQVRDELAASSRTDGSIMSAPARYMKALEDYGFDKPQDDITLLVFGARLELDGIYEATASVAPDDIDALSSDVGRWCAAAGMDQESAGRVELVLEEKLMNLYDHGFDERDRLREVVNVRLRRRAGEAELTVWDCGTAEPSLAVAAGDSSTAFEAANRTMSGHGRGRLIVRELCSGIERNHYGRMNETIYHIPVGLGASAAGR